MCGEIPGQLIRQPSHRFTRRLRLLRPEDFKRVFAKAIRHGHANVTMLASPNKLGHPRLGLAISRKHARRAVSRNLIKRQTRESFRLHQHDLPGIDIIVLSRPGIERLSAGELRNFLDSAWSKLARRCDAF